ncbi:MAG: hypothetical protein GY928_05410 [Colwellia sp.]|nr:hypothetical protein [Colwellia sp.]
MTTNNDHKAARRICDQYHCHFCGKQWDHDDPNPPTCERVESPGYTPKKRYSNGAYYCDLCDKYFTKSNCCEHYG